MPLITLTTDFQVGSPYIAQMKGVLYSRVPGVQIVDLTHAVPPQNIRFGAFALGDSVLWFPDGSIHIAVVDPGVGSERELICVRLKTNENQLQTVLCPNNGLLTVLLETCSVLEAFCIENSGLFLPQTSTTFHGRDIFSPVAAFLVQGGGISEVGKRITPEHIQRFILSVPRYMSEGIEGEILFEDSFGNLVTNITSELAQNPRGVQVGEMNIPFVRTYSEAQTGTIVALFGSQNRLELAVVNGNAAKVTGLGPNVPLILKDSRTGA